MYKIFYRKRALKDIELLKLNNLSEKAKGLIDIIRNNPFQNPPPYEKLIGDLEGAYSRRINVKHRLVYQVDIENKVVKILSMWSHYENV